MKRCEFTKKGTKYSLVLTLKSVDRASMWLDKFINDKAIKEFRIPNNDALKMKIDLVCVKPNTNKNAEEEAQWWQKTIKILSILININSPILIISNLFYWKE